MRILLALLSNIRRLCIRADQGSYNMGLIDAWLLTTNVLFGLVSSPLVTNDCALCETGLTERRSLFPRSLPQCVPMF